MSAQQIMISPRVLQETVQSFRLTSDEKAEFELECMKLSLGALKPKQKLALEELALTTTNSGIQYLLINHPKFSRDVAYSNYLDPRVVPYFLDRIANAKHESVHHDEIFAVNSLLDHKVVVGDVNLFKRAWDVALLFRALSVPPSTYDFINLCGALRFYSAEDYDTAISIDTLLFILAYLNQQEAKYEISPELGIARVEAVKARASEIKVWVHENMSDYVDVPLSWVLKVHDLNLPA